MAPLANYVVGEVAPLLKLIMLHGRQSVDNVPRQHHQIISDKQSRILQILALTFSVFSVTSSFLAFYWFMKMRRSFRHDLIMLLIQSDMFKALWFMIYPIVTFTSGRPSSQSTFCQVNGFFLAVGIEASDFSVLMIAIHSALYIFKPNNSGDEGGLYPYRKFAYACYIIMPLLLATLAFVNPENAYVSDGTYCYLPVRPIWYRLTLSWIPRYVIFIVILGIYASIYFYVRYKFRGFTEQQSTPSDQTISCDQDVPLQECQQRATSPVLLSHGLIPVSRQTTSNEEELQKPQRAQLRRNSSFVRPAELQRSGSFARRGSVHQFMLLASFTNRVEPALSTPTSELSFIDSESIDEQTTAQTTDNNTRISLEEPAVVNTPEIPNAFFRNDALSRQNTSVTRSPPQLKLSIVEPTDIARSPTIPRKASNVAGDIPLSRLYLTNSLGDNVTDLDMLRTRDKIRRQLRFLFIYPLVYIGMWIVPFVSHIMQYQTRYAHEPPFVLSCISVLCVCMQAAVDSWLFSTREKPWRHIPDTQGGFWESLRFWSGWHGIKERKIIKGPGRTREEMVKEARSAYKRRDAELAQRRTIIEAEAAVGAKAKRDSGVETPRRKGERSWWEDGRNSLDGVDELP